MNIEVRFNTYTSRNLATLVCETKDYIYTVDVYQSGAVNSRINYRNVTREAMDKLAYGRAVLNAADKLRDDIVSMLADEVTESYNAKWWSIKDALRGAELN